MSWTNNDGNILGKWLIPDDQTIANYICQSPKVSMPTTPPWDETTTPVEDLVCMEGYEDIYPAYNKCYYISQPEEVSSWEEAFSACDAMMNWDLDIDYNSLNCHLVSIDSQEENKALFHKIKDLNLQSVWIGLSWTGTYSLCLKLKQVWLI